MNKLFEKQEDNLLGIFVEERVSNVLEDAIRCNVTYQKARRQECKIHEKLEKVKLNKKQRKLFDKAMNAANYCSGIYGETAYKQGLKDGIKFILELNKFIDNNI